MAEKPTYEKLDDDLKELERIFNLSADMIGSGNLGGYFKKINFSFGKILGYTDEEFINKPFISFVHDEDVEKTKATLANAVEGKKEIYIENRYRCKDGSYKWIEWKVLSIVEENIFIAVGREITKRKQTQEALRKSEERFRWAYHTAPLAMVVWDKNTHITDWNKKAEEVFGWPKKDVVGTGFFDFLIPEKHRPHVEDIVKDLLKGQLTSHTINDNLTKDGRIITCEWNNSVFHDDEGNLMGAISLGLDITESKRAKEVLSLANQIINKSPAVAFLWKNAENWPIEFVSENVKEVLGYSAEDFLSGKISYAEILHPDDLERVEAEVARYSKSEKIKDFVHNPYRIITRDEQVKWIDDRTNIRRNENGVITHYQGIVLDITDRVRAEEEKRKALEFASEQSKHALIGQVAGKMAHDFNNLLMGIMGNAQLAIAACDDENIKLKLERIHEFSERGREITHNLMSFSKDQEPKQIYFRIENKIELVLKMFEQDLAGIKVSRNYAPGIPELLGDPGMIQDVLTNIIQNSIHAVSKVENPMLNLKAYAQEDKVYFMIEDNGCGIPKEHQESIFTPSFTLKGSYDKTGSYKPQIKGTGYGMSNVEKYIVKKHKGEIFLESEVGKGTRITIALKIVSNKLSSDEKKEITKNKIHDRRRILLVEDEPAIADVQYQILTKEPFYHVVTNAVNGQMAIDIFDRTEFDLASLDYMLPGNNNGLDVYNHIREKNQDIPVLLISGNIEFLDSINKLKEKDLNLEHLSKPVNNFDYVNKINELIGRSIKTHHS